MILTGKAKYDFLSTYYEEFFKDEWGIKELEYIFEMIPPVAKSAIIIEWFDSVGICIEIDASRFNDRYGFDCGFYYDNFNDYIAIDGFFNSRQGATEQAIEKANEIYNENKA